MEDLVNKNYKEKYDKVLEWARNFYNSKYADLNLRITLEDVFPELKESEDERVRKELIRAFTVTADKRGHEIYGNGITYGQVLAWLEKQGEQKHVSNALKEAFDKSRKDYSLEEKKEASDYSESIIPTSIAYGESEEEYMLHKIIEAAFIAGQNTKQKPAWSEEDVKCCNTICFLLHDLEVTSEDKKLAENWLKSLKERMKGE